VKIYGIIIICSLCFVSIINASGINLNDPPNTPDPPIGSAGGIAGEIYVFEATGTDPDDDLLYYLFDWGDGSFSDWIGPFISGGRAYGFHGWANTSNNISEKWTWMFYDDADFGEGNANVVDIFAAEAYSSEKLDVIVLDDGRFDPAKIWYIDENHNKILLDEWGDGTNSGWLGPFSSGEKQIVSHSWDEKGVFTLRAKAKNTEDVEMEWATLEVDMPKTKTYTNNPFLQFLENHPQLLPWLQQLIGL